MQVKEILTTDRLILRPLENRDLDRVHSWASVPANVRYMDWGPNSKEDSLAFILTAKAGNEFGVVLAEKELLIGSCGIYPKSDGAGEIGWILHQDYWRLGYGKEIARALIAYGFETMGFQRLYAVCATDNLASYKLMESVGMKRESVNTKARWGRVDNKLLDQYVYAISAAEYLGSKKSGGVDL